MKMLNTKQLATTAILAASVVALDYSLKVSNLKIPFPIYPAMKFDFTGIPIAVATLLCGFVPGVFTSITAFVAILARSGDLVGSSMKAAAELSTVVGIVVGSRMFTRHQASGQCFFGILMRCVVMVLATVPLFTLYSAPFVTAFNVVQGSITVFGGYAIYLVIIRTMPETRTDLASARSDAAVGVA